MKKSEEIELVNYIKETIRSTNQVESSYEKKIVKIEDRVFFQMKFQEQKNLEKILEKWDISTIPKNTVVVLQCENRKTNNLAFGIIFKEKSHPLLNSVFNLSIIDSLEQYLLEINEEDVSSNSSEFRILFQDGIYHKNKKISNLKFINNENQDENKVAVVVEININSAIIFPSLISRKSFKYSPGCLREFTRSVIDLNQIEEFFFVNLNYRINSLFINNESKQLSEDINKVLKWKSQEIKIVNNDKIMLSGLLEGIDELGSLTINTSEGKKQKIPYSSFNNETRLVSFDNISNSITYNKCNCISNFNDKRSRKFYYFLTATAITLFARFFYNKSKVK